MSIKKAIYAGTFDPFTRGHLDLVNRALNLFDEIIIVIAIPPGKKPMFNKDIRCEMIEQVFADYDNVKVDTWDGLLIEYAQTNDVNVFLRGLRPTGDFENEFQMASINNKLYPDIETYFLMTGGDLYFVSSSLVREVLSFGKDVSKFVPPQVKAIMDREQKGK